MSKYRYPRLPITALTFIVLRAVWYANLAPASAQTVQPEDKQDSVHGIVVNSVTHEPVARALVYSPDNRFATMTDGDGKFEFTFAPTEPDKNNKDEESGSANVSHTTRSCVGTDCVTYTSSDRAMNHPYALQARKPGFLNDQNGAQTLQSVTAGKELTISLIPEALVVGRVTLPTSEASEAIQLEIYRRQVQEGRAHWILGGSASTKSDGEFRFAELPAGTYRVLTRELQDRDPLTFDPADNCTDILPFTFQTPAILQQRKRFSWRRARFFRPIFPWSGTRITESKYRSQMSRRAWVGSVSSCLPRGIGGRDIRLATTTRIRQLKACCPTEITRWKHQAMDLILHRDS